MSGFPLRIYNDYSECVFQLAGKLFEENPVYENIAV
jgi:hypothetical protein